METVSADDRRANSEDLDLKDQVRIDPFAGLRRIPDKFPSIALLILVVEVCHPLCVRSHDDALTSTYQLGERFTYFGLSGPIQNYIKYATPYFKTHKHFLELLLISISI